MKKVYIIHGLQGTPNGNWKPYLLRELEKKNIWACSIPMTDEEDPDCSEWVRIINSYVKKEDEVVLVAHSLGARAVLRYLDQGNISPIVGVVLVSGRFGKPRGDALHSFYDKALDFDRIMSNALQRCVVHGDNDPIIPYSDAILLSEALVCELVTIPGGGHLTKKAQCFELPDARDAVLKMMGI